MTRAFPVKAALILSLGLLGACNNTPAGPKWATDIQPLFANASCSLGNTCHGATQGAATPPLTNKLKIVLPGMEATNCAGVTNAANGLINASSPTMSKLVTYPYASTHTGGKLPGWSSATDASIVKVEEWIMAGASCAP